MSLPLRRFLWAVLTGAAYGLCVRLSMEWQALHPFFQIVSTAFLVLCPFSVGAVAVLRGAGPGAVSVWARLKLASAAMLVFLVAMFATMLEGLICIVLVAPVFLVAAALGGLVAGWVHNRRQANATTLSAFVLLPLVVSPIESLLPPASSVQQVSNTLHIAAPPEQVFSQLGQVKAIAPEELGFTFVHLIGLPKPLSAEMNCEAVGCARTSRWEKQVWFQEVVTEWRAPYSLRYRFVIPKGAIPREALDRHVEMGGDYFDLVDGGYSLVATPDGGTDLTLSTRFENKSQLKLYGDLWGRMVLKDFHRSILHLMKVRAERAQAAGSAEPGRRS